MLNNDLITLIILAAVILGAKGIIVGLQKFIATQSQ